MFGPPVDLSFRHISSLEDAWPEDPGGALRPLKRNPEKKSASRGLRLNNNDIADLRDLQRTVGHFLSEPSQLAWLDLSFNRLPHVDHVLCELRALRVLYLHGNDIFILSEVDRLGELPHLQTVTLHGNMIATHRNYRNRVVSALPQLKTMDFSAVTPQDRVTATIWRRSSDRRRGSGDTPRRAAPEPPESTGPQVHV
ncbi:leucine rich repeat containing 51 [Pseudoliparis swirei]|uniref:leucine rich repeat containing 51 n=1 Tax=Pseudoliparis swirei TaxID=2059687 RepID=UPI0024BDEA97|nr:leucine rich repeat containing 51 [Pseudoliparis swirei]